LVGEFVQCSSWKNPSFFFLTDESSEDYARFEDSYSLMLENLREKGNFLQPSHNNAMQSKMLSCQLSVAETGIEMEARGGKTYFRMSRDVGFPHKPWTYFSEPMRYKINEMTCCVFIHSVAWQNPFCGRILSSFVSFPRP